MQKQTFIFVKVSVGFTISYPPPPLWSKDVHCQQLQCGSWCCVCWLLPLSSYLSILFWAIWGGGGEYICNKRSMSSHRTKERCGANMRISLFWIRSHGKGRRGEEFRELTMEHWRWEDAEQKEGPGVTGTERKPQTFFLPLPRYYLVSRQLAFSFHVISIHEKPSWRYWVITGQNKTSATAPGFRPTS